MMNGVSDDLTRRGVVEASGYGLIEKDQGGRECGTRMSHVDGWGFGLLAEFDAVGAEDEGNVRIDWRFQAEKALKLDLAGRGIEQVRAADYVRDALPGIVDNDGEMIGPYPVGAEEREAFVVL